MLPTLHGRAIFETCSKCGFHGLRCSTGTSVCPNCGWLTLEKERETLAHEIRPADRLRIVPQPKYTHDDLVVVIPSPEIGPVVKRVVGVPGDRLEIRDGALFRNGKQVVHSLVTWYGMRVLVFHDDFRPARKSRWKPLEKSCVPMKDGWELAGNSGETTGGTIEYVHETARFTSTGCRFVPGPITNQRAENGTQFPESAVQFPKEFMLEFEIEFGKEVNQYASQKIEKPCVCVTFPTFRLTWAGSSDSALHTSDSALHTPDSALHTSDSALHTSHPTLHTLHSYVFSSLDGVPRIWVDGQPAKTSEMKVEKGDFGVIQIRNLAAQKVQIHHLTLWKGEVWGKFLTNFHYFKENEEKIVAFDCGAEYYVIGNNFFVSDDSRIWGTISPQQILGKAFFY